MKIIQDFRNKVQIGLVNFMEDGMPWTKVFGKYRILWTFQDEGYGPDEMMALENSENKDDPIFVPSSSVLMA